MSDEPEDKTPTDILIELMGNDFDTVEQLLVIYRRADGTIGYSAANQRLADSLGLMRFAQIDMEETFRRSFNE